MRSRFIRPAAREILPPLLLDAHAARGFARARSLAGHTFRRYRSARRAHLDLVPPSVPLHNGLVVDVGANVGEWTGHVRSFDDRIEVLAVEPNSEPRRILERRFCNDRRVSIESRALAQTQGE